jgi:hypothetical protein
VIRLSAAADGALNALTLHYNAFILHYEALGRDRAIDRLVTSVETACGRYENKRGLFFDTPRPYPGLADLGFRWTKEGSYWIAFEETGTGPGVAGIFHEAADMPNRL